MEDGLDGLTAPGAERAEVPMPAALTADVSTFVRQYFMFLLVGACIAYYIYRKLFIKYDDYQSKATHRSSQLSEIDKFEGMARARERQQQYIAECAVKDAELREQRAKAEDEERKRRMAAAMPAATGAPPTLPRTLGGVTRDTYRPSGGGSGGGGGSGYRPTGFRRPAGGGG